MKRLVAAILMLTFFAVPSYGKVVDYIAAVVNGQPILYSEILEYAKDNGIRDLKVARDSLIESKILLTEAKNEGLNVSDKEVTNALENLVKHSGLGSMEAFKKALNSRGLTFNDVKKKLREQLLVAKLVARNVKSKIHITDIDVEKACKERQSKPVREVYYIFTKNKGKADKLMELLNSGVPFEKVAKEYSEDRATAENGGYIGKVAKGSLIKPLDIAVWSTKPKSYRLVQGKSGYYIVYVKRELVEGCNKNKIGKELYRQKFQGALKDYVDSLKKRASVKVYF